MKDNVSIYEMPFYMVDSSEYGHHLYTSLDDALTAVEASAADIDDGGIFVMTVGPSYQDSTTKEIFWYKKDETTVFQSVSSGLKFSYKDLVTLP